MKTRVSSAVEVVGLGLALTVSGLPSGAAPAVNHVVQISVDALAAKFLQFYVSNAPAEYPNFGRLMREGAYTFNARCDYESSESVPNHVTILTGRPVRQPAGQANTVHHGYDNNFPGAADTIHKNGNTNVAYKASVFDVVHDHGGSTAFLSGKSRLTVCARSYNATNGAPDTVGSDQGRNKMDLVFISDSASATTLVNALLTNLNTAPQTYAFLHLNDADSVGHAQGWGGAAWSNTVRALDQQLGRILTAVDASAVLSNRTAILLAADHGGGGDNARNHTNFTHLTNYTIPLFIRAPGVPAGVDAYRLFFNRADPGTNRIDYDAAAQPLRHGDLSNLALELLGLPPIPGSILVPLRYPTLVVRKDGQQWVLEWSSLAASFTLESANTLSLDGLWTPMRDGLVTNATSVTFALPWEPRGRFFRLRK
jgi:hypothetical protein